MLTKWSVCALTLIRGRPNSNYVIIRNEKFQVVTKTMGKAMALTKYEMYGVIVNSASTGVGRKLIGVL